MCSQDIELVVRMLIAVISGAIIGSERQLVHRPAGLRTHILVCLGSCIFTIVSTEFATDPARIAAGVVTGIGFIGAGTILAERNKDREMVLGVTTAASLWTTAAIGVLIGIGKIFLALSATAIVFFVLWIRVIERRLFKEKV
jgi:putative Mg2+ transporter-C (MgtC) family protein